MVGVVSIADREKLAEGKKNSTVRTLWMSNRSRAGGYKVGVVLGSSEGRKVL